ADHKFSHHGLEFAWTAKFSSRLNFVDLHKDGRPRWDDRLAIHNNRFIQRGAESFIRMSLFGVNRIDHPDIDLGSCWNRYLPCYRLRRRRRDGRSYWVLL